MIDTGRHQEETPHSTYPLTALQHGMLFHHLLEPNSGVDVEQQVLSLPEEIDPALMRRAWEHVTRRHDALRTSFRWHEADQPVQDVWASVELPFRYEDLRQLGSAESAARVSDYLRTDRRDGFSMDLAPLSRVALFRLGERAYELAWTFHHAVVDGRSFVLVWREAMAVYESLERGEVPDESMPSPTFAEHVGWLQQHDFSPAEAYWRKRLDGVDAPTPLPAGFPDAESAAVQPRGERQIVVGAETIGSLERFARENDVTLNTILQGAWALLLARHSGESEVIFGATRAGRRSSIPNADDVVGLLINTLPVRVSVAPHRSLAEWLRDMRSDWTEMRDYEQTPLPTVQRWSALPGGANLFDSIVVYDTRLLQTALRSFGGRWEARSIRIFEQTNFPLTLAIYGDAELAVKLQYDRTRFDDPSIERVLGHYRRLLEGIGAAEPGQTLGTLPWLTTDEHTQLVVSWNATATAYPRDATIPSIFAARVAAAPDAVALVHGSETLRYRELDERANRLAHRLHRLGVGPGVPVGLCTRRSIAMVVGALAIVKAGGAYVPLDPTYPAERLRFMADDAGLAVILIEECMGGVLPPGPTAVRLDTDWPSIATEPSEPPPLATTPDATANIIFTSGSTGTPKGVLVTHRGVIRLTVNTTYAHFGPDEVMLAVASLSFDASTFELWGALLNGGRLVLLEAAPPTLDDIVAAIAAHGATMLLLTAALFHQMVDHRLDGLRPLRTLLAGGDVVSATHAQRLARELPSLRLINAYGPTENAVITSCFDVTPDWNASGSATTLPIGRPISNTTVYVLDAGGNPVPIGVAGRLFTGGDGVARGYHERPELTAERFVHDPFSERPGAQMYDTGDRVSWRPDGTLDFLGRADHQLKIRGFRIEPGEIEAALLADTSVGAAVVVGHDGAGGEKRLVAYVVARGSATIDIEPLRASLAERLPAYLVPSEFVVLEALPISPNGKVDRARLPRPEAGDAARRQRPVAPRTATEHALAQIWTEVLGVEHVGVHDNFLALGGHSLLAMQVASRIRDAFRVEVPVRAIFAEPTVEQLALALIERERKPGQVERIAQLMQRVAEMSLEDVRLAASPSAPATQERDRTDAQ